MDERRKNHLQMIQGIIDRMARNSFQLKGWTVTLATALEVFLKGEAKPPGSSCRRCRSLPFGCWMHGIFVANGSSAASSITCEQNAARPFFRWPPPFRPRNRASARRCHVTDHHRLLRSGVAGRHPLGTLSCSIICHERCH